MSYLTINLNEIKQKKSKNRGLEGKETNLHSYLVQKAINLKVSNNNLLIKPNYKLITFKLKLFFSVNNVKYSLIIDGVNKLIIVKNVRLININKIKLEFLKVDKNLLNMF